MTSPWLRYCSVRRTGNRPFIGMAAAPSRCPHRATEVRGSTAPPRPAAARKDAAGPGAEVSAGRPSVTSVVQLGSRPGLMPRNPPREVRFALSGSLAAARNCAIRGRVPGSEHALPPSSPSSGQTPLLAPLSHGDRFSRMFFLEAPRFDNRNQNF